MKFFTRKWRNKVSIFLLLSFFSISLIPQISAQDLKTGKYYQIIAKHSGKALDVKVASKNNGGKIHQWDQHGEANQLFKLEEAGDNYYRIISKNSGKAFDITGGPHKTENGVHLQQWDPVGGDNQLFQIIDNGDGYFQLMAKHSQKVLDVYGSCKDNGATVIQYESTGSDNQLFKFVSVDDQDLGPEY